ncbi:MAG: ABC transporter ATP-binding protein, partial [Chloroflexota bacterium]
ELVALLAAHRDAGGGLVFATHDRDLVSALADRTVALRDGRAA